MDRNEDAVENDLVHVKYIKAHSPDTEVYISEITPRRDADVSDMYKFINYLCKDNEAVCISKRQRLKLNIFSYWKDQIHLSDKGTAVLLKTYNDYQSILKKDSGQKKYIQRICCFLLSDSKVQY